MSDVISNFNTDMKNMPRVKQQNVVPAMTKTNLLAQYNSTNNSIEFKQVDGTVFFALDLTYGVVNIGTIQTLPASTGFIGILIGGFGGLTGEKVGFFGTTPILQPLLTTGTGKTVDNVITVLQNLGLVRQS